MPSTVVVKYGYRKAKCCGTCASYERRYCSLLGMSVQDNSVCNKYSADKDRASKKVMCDKCGYGVNGDHSCVTGCSNTPADKGCYSGKELNP